MFSKRFAPMVKAGTKRQTIRPVPKRLPKVGDLESWREWTGNPYHSKQRELAQVEIVGVERIRIVATSSLFQIYLPDRPFNGGLMKPEEWDAFAKADGFDSMLHLVEWFGQTHGLPFEGILIKAEDAK
jgi:hypothetical protein